MLTFMDVPVFFFLSIYYYLNPVFVAACGIFIMSRGIFRWGAPTLYLLHTGSVAP